MSLTAEQRARLRATCLDYLAAVDRGERPRLADVVAQHPDLARELVEFAEFCHTVEHAPPAPAAVASAPAGESAAQRALAARFGSAPLDSIVIAAQRRGLTPAEFAERLGVGLDVLGKLDRRLVRAATIPAAFLARLGNLVGATPAAVAAYLDAGPRPATAGALLHAAAPPAPVEPQSFAQAIADSPLTDPAARARWLALAASDTES